MKKKKKHNGERTEVDRHVIIRGYFLYIIHHKKKKREIKNKRKEVVNDNMSLSSIVTRPSVYCCITIILNYY